MPSKFALEHGKSKRFKSLRLEEFINKLDGVQVPISLRAVSDARVGGMPT